MSEIRVSDYVYCPYCANRLTTIILEKIPRKTCAYCGGWIHFPSVGLASVGIIVRKNKILLVQRNHNPYKNTWGFPAGFVEYGEHPLDALRREIYQEVGLIVTKARFTEFIQSNEDPRSLGHLVLFYWVTAAGQIANNDTDENKKIGWFDIKNPPEIGWPTHKEMVRLLQTKNGIKKIKGGKTWQT